MEKHLPKGFLCACLQPTCSFPIKRSQKMLWVIFLISTLYRPFLIISPLWPQLFYLHIWREREGGRERERGKWLQHMIKVIVLKRTLYIFIVSRMENQDPEKWLSKSIQHIQCMEYVVPVPFFNH